jgi:hypothetical protein
MRRDTWRIRMSASKLDERELIAGMGIGGKTNLAANSWVVALRKFPSSRIDDGFRHC